MSPFASDKQRKFLWSQKPKIAKEFAEKEIKIKAGKRRGTTRRLK